MSFRYMIETYHHANEILQMIGEADRDLIHSTLEPQYPAPFLPLSEKRMTKALRFLVETPTERQRRWEKLDQHQQMRLWTTTRYLALRAANAIAVSETVSAQTDGAYRKATQNIAKAVHDHRLQPTAWEIAHLRK